MLRIRLDINGRVIGTIAVHNQQEYNDQGEVLYHVHDVSDALVGDDISEYPQLLTLWHDRTDGASALTARVMDEIDESTLDDVRT